MAVSSGIKLPNLSDRRRRFAEEYLIDLNATQAAIRAGYSPRSAAQQASELLKNPNIRAYIDARMAELSRRTGVNQERVIRELARIAFVDPTRVVNVDDASIREDATEDDRAAIQSVKVKQIETEQGLITEREVRFYDKNRALELLGKRYALWTEKHEVDLSAKVEIVDDIPEPQDDAEAAETSDTPDGD